MKRETDSKIVLVTQKTRLENLVQRYNTYGQAKFYIEHHGGDFSDYSAEHETYQSSAQKATRFLETYGRLQVIDRDNVPNYIFGKEDIVIALGRDGLVANVLKYLENQVLIGVNPDPARWDGLLLPFRVEDLQKIVPETVKGIRSIQHITMAQAKLSDGQIIYGVNDLFIGQKTHTSARYELSQGRKRESQSSSGIIVSTGLGATGWLKSVIAGAQGVARYCGVENLGFSDKLDKNSPLLYYTVREPYPSNSTGAELVFGKIEQNSPLSIVSNMPENGVIFSDGVEQDFLQFNSGVSAEIRVADRQGSLVV